MARRLAPLVIALLLIAAPPGWAAEVIERLPTRPGVTLDFLFEAPEHPVAAVLLLAGGEGNLGIHEADGVPALAAGGNFLVRSRHLFAAQGLMVATIDAPSDQSDGMDPSFRLSAAHAEDIGAVVAWMRSQAELPVWLVGTSMGTLSAAKLAVRLGHKIDGVVLTSTVSRGGGKHSPHRLVAPEGVLSLGIEQIAVPVLVMAHKGDACFVTPPEDAPRIQSRLSASPRTALVLMEGGDSPRSGPCMARAQHGYVGVEPQAVEAIARFIEGQ